MTKTDAIALLHKNGFTQFENKSENGDYGLGSRLWFSNSNGEGANISRFPDGWVVSPNARDI